ncbi:MAG: hypothetical protein WCF62_32330, partial [Pseudolabrys sp.]
MSALPPKADIPRSLFDVRFVPIADIGTNTVGRLVGYSITSSARATSDGGTAMRRDRAVLRFI